MSSTNLQPTLEFEIPADLAGPGRPPEPVESPDPLHASPRSEDVALKQTRVAEFLEDEGYDGILLSRQDSFAWFSAGGDSGAGASSDAGTVSLYITRDQRCVLANNVHSGRIFEEEIAGLGFQLKECRWDDAPDRLVSDICRGRKVASDTGVAGTVNELDKIGRAHV